MERLANDSGMRWKERSPPLRCSAVGDGVEEGDHWRHLGLGAMRVLAALHHLLVE